MSHKIPKTAKFQCVINQVNCAIAWYKKTPPFDTEYYQTGEGFKNNTNPFRKLSLEELLDIQERLISGLIILKKNKVNKLSSKLNKAEKKLHELEKLEISL